MAKKTKALKKTGTRKELGAIKSVSELIVALDDRVKVLEQLNEEQLQNIIAVDRVLSACLPVYDTLDRMLGGKLGND